MPSLPTLLSIPPHRRSKPLKTHTLAAAVLAALLSGAAQAVENGAPITPFGVMDFGAGQLPPASEIGTVGLRWARYRAGELRDDAGNKSPVAAQVAVDSVGLAYVRMTDLTIGSAKFGWGAVLPVLRTRLDLTVPTPLGPLALSGENTAQGDLQLIPAILSWTPSPGLYTSVQLVVQLPTGGYDKARLINAGTNHRTVSPGFAFTWITAGGLELSSNVQVNFNSRNTATDYTSGREYQHEFALGQHVGAWTFGLGGYHYQQISDDRGPGVVNGHRARVTALGPAVHFLELGSGLPVVWVHAYKEFNARNRSQGTQLAARLAWVF